MAARARIGDERFRLEIIETAAVEALARKQGWDGSDGLREFCEPEDAAEYPIFKTLADAEKAARAHLATGKSFYGCAIIDRQVLEEAHDDRGNLIRGIKPEWETVETFEVAMDGQTIKVAA